MSNKNKNITLESLCGIHLLQGFELTEQNIKRYGSLCKCNVVKFMLDGITYIAIEDPDDGYRSYCEEIKVSSEKPKYSIPDCEVLCAMKPSSDGEDEHDVLIGIDTHTGLIVFEIGTMYVNDFYPYCHFEYHPENMFCNEQRRTNNEHID